MKSSHFRMKGKEADTETEVMSMEEPGDALYSSFVKC